MQLRNRTIAPSSVSTTNVHTDTIIPGIVPGIVPDTDRYGYENSTSNTHSICLIINNYIQILPTIETNERLSEEEKFISKIRLFRELYYIIGYYDLKSNPRFSDKFIPATIEKAKNFIIDLNQMLIADGCFGKTRISPRNAKNHLIKEFVDELEQFIRNQIC